MAHSSVMLLQSLDRLERLQPADGPHHTHSGRTALPPLPSSTSAASASSSADMQSAPAQSPHRSRSSSLSNNIRRPLSPSAQRVQAAEMEGEDDEDEARMHAQYRLKQRLKEKSRYEASRHKRQQRADDTEGELENEEERELRLTSLTHHAAPPPPILRTRSLRTATLPSTGDTEVLPSVSSRTTLGELSVLHQQRQRVVGYTESEEQCDEDVEMEEDGTANSSATGASTPCFRVAKRLQPSLIAQKAGVLARSDGFASPFSYSTSPAASSTLSTAAASPTFSVPSVTRSVASSMSPHSIFSSPAILPSVLLHSPTLECSKQRASDGRPVAMFTRRHLT